MNDAIKDFLIKIMSAFPHSFIKYYVYGGFEITLDEQNVLWFSLGEIESDLELKRRFISAISRCYKTEPYRTSKRNIEWQQKHIAAYYVDGKCVRHATLMKLHISTHILGMAATNRLQLNSLKVDMI